MRAETIAEVMRIAEDCGLSYWSEADYRAELEREGSYTFQAEATSEQAITGFIIVRLITIQDEQYASTLEILNIAVKENYRKTGVGTLLIRSAIQVAREHSPASIRLEVRVSNQAAIEFYKKHGFKPEHVRRSFYSNPVEDGIVMKLDL